MGKIVQQTGIKAMRFINNPAKSTGVPQAGCGMLSFWASKTIHGETRGTI